MNRYKITQELRNAILNSEFSLNKINELCSFQVKNIVNKNISINENHLCILNKILKLNKEDLNLKQIKFDYAKNLGDYSANEPIKFKGKSEEFAEFIGLMLGDGNIYKNIITVTLDKREKEYIKFVNSLFYKIFGLNFNLFIEKRINRVSLHKCYKDLVKILLEYGLKRGNKKLNNVGIPNWIFNNKKYLKACLRGLIDTDGCVYFCKRDKKLYLKFTNRSSKLLEDFKRGCKKFDINFVKGGWDNTHLYKKVEVERFMKVIGFSNTKHKQRSKLDIKWD